MINMKVKKIFSIPGRIRLQIEGLKLNITYAKGIEIALMQIPNVKSVCTNTKTGNTLIIYDNNLIEEYTLLRFIYDNCIDTSTILAENPSIQLKEFVHENGYRYDYFNNHLSSHELTKTPDGLFDGSFNGLFIGLFNDLFNDLFREEISLSKRLFVISVIAASLLLVKTFRLSAISALVFGFPVTIFLITYLSLKYTLIVAKSKMVCINNTRVIRKIQKLNHISLHPGIVFKNNTTENFSYIEIENQIANGELEDPIHLGVRNLVRDLRTIGINHISIIPIQGLAGLLHYGNKSLGLNASEKDEFFEINKEAWEMLIIDEYSIHNHMMQRKGNSIHLNMTEDQVQNNRITLCVSENSIENYNNIHINCNELSKIPWLIELCMRSNEYATRSQATAASVNIFGIMLAFIRLSYLSTSLLLYILNTLFNILYLRHNIFNYNKEKSYGEQRKFVNACNKLN